MADKVFRAAAYTALGTERERVPLPAEVFDGTVNVPVMHQAVKALLANNRQGTAKTKTRGEVAGGNQKPWRQKGTGRARQGSIRAPNWVGGGTVFGPQPRSYAQDVPRQVRQAARRSAFNARAMEESVIVIDRFDYDAPKTSRLVSLLARLGVADGKVLLLTDGVKHNVYMSGRNLPNVHVMPYSDASTYHILWSDVVLIEAGAIGHALEPVAEKEHAPVKRPARKRTAAGGRTRARKSEDESDEEVARPAARAATKRGAKRRPAAKKAGGRGSTAKKKSAGGKKPAARKSAPKKGGSKKKGK